MTRHFVFVVWLLALLVPSTVFADVIPPGQKSISAEVYVDGTENFPQYRFFAYPTDMGGGFAEIVPGNEVDFYHFSAPRIYAVPVDAVPADLTGEFFETGDFAVSGVALDRTTTASQFSPIERMVARYEVFGVENGVVMVNIGSVELYDGKGNPVTGGMDGGGGFNLPGVPPQYQKAALVVLVMLAGLVIIVILAVIFRARNGEKSA